MMAEAPSELHFVHQNVQQLLGTMQWVVTHGCSSCVPIGQHKTYPTDIK
jgi:hypothetical protein